MEAIGDDLAAVDITKAGLDAGETTNGGLEAGETTVGGRGDSDGAGLRAEDKARTEDGRDEGDTAEEGLQQIALIKSVL